LDEAVAARDCGCDLVIVHGRESGGRNPKGIGLIALLQQVLEALPDVPVLAAGGIATGRGLAAVLAAGADGARVGTRFVAAAESGAHPVYVRALLAASGEDTVLTDAFSAGWPDGPATARVLRDCVDRAQAHPDALVGHMSVGSQELPIPLFSPPPPATSMTGVIEAMPLYAGEGGRPGPERPAGVGHHRRDGDRRGASASRRVRANRVSRPRRYSCVLTETGGANVRRARSPRGACPCRS
jgi:hypothetical protein